jgi:hypothetical protein
VRREDSLERELDGSLLRTSIPLNLEFARKRKAAQEEMHFAQLVRLVKLFCRAASPSTPCRHDLMLRYGRCTKPDMAIADKASTIVNAGPIFQRQPE